MKVCPAVEQSSPHMNDLAPVGRCHDYYGLLGINE